MKFRIILLISFLLPELVNAQLSFGIKGGLNLTSIKSEDVLTADYHIDPANKTKTGFHVGLFSRISLFGLYVQPELLYTVLRGEIYIHDLSGLQDIQTAQQQINRLDIPVLAGFKLGPARIGAGPVASFTLAENSQIKEITGYVEDIRLFTVGYQAGVGIDISQVTLGARYEGNLRKLGDGIDVSGEILSFDTRASQFIFSLELAF